LATFATILFTNTSPFHQGCVLHTKAFAPSTTATTVGDGGNPKCSTELAEVTGHNCDMSQDNYLVLPMLVLGLWQGKTHGTKQRDSSFVNMLLEDLVSLSNLTAVFTLDKLADQRALAPILARFSILLLGADALTPTIILETVCGANTVVCCNLGGSRGNLAIIRHHLISLACVAINAYHCWLTTTFNGGTIIPSNILQ
jgi:hypothetical protein